MAKQEGSQPIRPSSIVKKEAVSIKPPVITINDEFSVKGLVIEKVETPGQISKPSTQRGGDTEQK